MRHMILALFFMGAINCWAQSAYSPSRLEAEYYVRAHAQHYRLPVALVEAVVERESNWHPCAISPKGAVGLMQLMPLTAERLGVRDRCNIDQNVSGGVRHLAWLVQRFDGDFRLALAAYYAGEDIVTRRGLEYRNRDVVAYVSGIRSSYMRIVQAQTSIAEVNEKGDIR
ncbi:MAG TPA: lytic transglycosylase domain-containing protein [Candidatus Angelobacter sp.]|nr:lytic transglycosylase domain-containing protein [Candidatus Angelobacter sp.]